MEFDARKDAETLIRFMERSEFRSQNLNSFQLPDPSVPPYKGIGHVTLTTDRLKRFADRYSLLCAFAAYCCGTTVEKLCDLDMIARLFEARLRAEEEFAG